MDGIGTLINTGAVLAGSCIGIFLKNGIKKATQDILMQTCGVAVIFIGIAGTLKEMLQVVDGVIQIQGTMLMIFSLVIGGLVGQLLNIEKRLDGLGDRIKKAVKAKEDHGFVEGFVNTSLIICVGAMAIVGSIQDGLSGDFSMLAAKSILDFVIVIVFASAYGVGVLFSAFAIFIYQGSITLITILIGPILGDALIAQISFIGSVLIFCVGINIAFGKRLNVGNMLPALLGPVVYEIFFTLTKLYS